jgi:hypothetical protein
MDLLTVGVTTVATPANRLVSVPVEILNIASLP